MNNGQNKLNDSIENTPLTAEEQAKVNEYAAAIDITDSGALMQYGSDAQQKIADFSESALEGIRTRDFGETGNMITELVTELKGFKIDEEKKGLARVFSRGKNRIAKLKYKFDKAERNVERIVEELDRHQITLMKDIATLDEMYDRNLEYFKELTIYILAGKQKLEALKGTDLPKLLKKAVESGLPEDAQAARDLESMINRFEKKLHDLEITRVISIQTAPQIRMVQANDSQMSEKIQSTLVNTIPLWKNQMLLALGIEHSRQAIETQQRVSDMTNELLRSNAEKLRLASVETAKAGERAIVDVETLENTNRELITTLDEVMRIQSEGRQKRAEAEKRLRSVEDEMKQKLLEIKK